MKIIKNVLVSLYLMLVITALVIVLAYAKIGPVENASTAETTEVEITKVDTQ